MRRVKRNRNRRRGGFTLLEVLLVVGIIALLAAAVVPQFLGTEKRAKIDTARTAVSPGGTLASAIELFRQHVGRYPEELKELTEKPEDEDEAERWAGPYIKGNELEDPWGRELKYAVGDDAEYNKESYDLWSLGPDEDDDDDNIGNWRVEGKD